jgi:hypothetical protein
MSKEKYRRYVFEKHKDHMSEAVFYTITVVVVVGDFSSMGNTHAVYLWGWSAPKGHPQPQRLAQINVLFSVL